MNLLLFCVAFIFQYVGHRIGDYLLQTNYQAQNKANNFISRFKHYLVYSLTILLLWKEDYFTSKNEKWFYTDGERNEQ